MASNTPEIKIIGPFASEYSLAKVNREFANALDKKTDKYKITLYADENSTDKMPGTKEFQKYPELKKLFSGEKSHSRIAIYNNFPKSFPHSFELEKIDADIKLVFLAWEETGFPESIAMEFNQELHGVLVTSEHVANILRNAGVKIPIVNISEGLDPKDVKLEKYKLKTKKNFKFLHVSSGLPRKGVDVLMKAYFEEFDKNDDVVLVIKTYHNEANEFPRLIEELTTADSPEVEIIYDLELTDGQMASLYEQCDAVVLPSRAEGFGLPQGEAMRYGVPLITTAYSGQTDFANSGNSWMLDYELVQAESQLALMNSFWAEPDKQQLREFMRKLSENIDDIEVNNKVELAKEAAGRLTWGKTAQKALDFIEELEQFSALKSQKLAVISTINSKCGIAEYSRDFYQPISRSFDEVKFFANTDADMIFQDNEQVERTWEHGEHDFAKTIKAIRDYDPDILHIQYNSPFYSLEALSKLIDALYSSKTKIYLTIHSLPKADFGHYVHKLGQVSQIFVHSREHFDYFESKNYKNVTLFTHGVTKYADESKAVLRKKLKVKGDPIIASHGLIHDKKGLLEILEAVKILKNSYPDVLFLSVNAVNTDNVTSTYVSEQINKKIKELGIEENVVRITDFIDKSEIVKLLHLADLIALPYADLKEGASGAVRDGLASNRPVIRTNSSIFRDLGDVGYVIDNNQPEKIASAVKELIENQELYDTEVGKAKEFVEENSWDRQGRKYLVILGEVRDE